MTLAAIPIQVIVLCVTQDGWATRVSIPVLRIVCFLAVIAILEHV